MAVVSASPRATTRARCDHFPAALSGELKARLCKTTADADSVNRIAAPVAAAQGYVLAENVRLKAESARGKVEDYCQQQPVRLPLGSMTSTGVPREYLKP